MLSLQEHRTELCNLRTTIEALEELERLKRLINLYATDMPGPVYVAFEKNAGRENINVQFNRKILSVQHKTLVDYLAKLGIQA
jgi:hypothetical protein